MLCCPKPKIPHCPAVCRVLNFPRPPSALAGDTLPVLHSPGPDCLTALFGSHTPRGGSGWPGGWDKDRMKFPTLPHPIRKQAEGDRERVRLRGNLGKDSDELKDSRFTEELQIGTVGWMNTTVLQQLQEEETSGRWSQMKRQPQAVAFVEL